MPAKKSANLIPEQVLPPPAIRGYKQLLRLIRADRIQAGDRLPTQPQLRQRLNLGNDTISAMMSMLSESGAITRKSRVGTVLQDPRRLPEPDWVVGLGTFPAPTKGPSSFFAELALRLQVELARRDIRSLPYFRFSERSPVRMEDFRHLPTDLEQQQLDGFITMLYVEAAEWEAVRQTGLALTHACSTRPMPDGILLDQAAMVRQAVADLCAQGCRKPAIVMRTPRQNLRHPAMTAFTEACEKAGLPEHAVPYLDGGHSLDGGARVANELIALAEDLRPDGLIVLDEYVGLALLDGLRQSAGYRPQAAVLCSRQASVQFALPVLRFEIDIDRVARRCATHLRGRLVDPTADEWIEPIEPVRVK